jgi:endonuclease/exonuclease/phosphatase family metal-dependent hydrolase
MRRSRTRKRSFCCLLLLFLLACPLLLPTQTAALRICTYNVLNFPGSTGSSREDDFRAVINEIDPDVLVVQEMLSSSGQTQFLNNVMNYGQPGTYAVAPFIDGYDTDNSLYYKVATVDFLSQTVISTALRDINEYILRPDGYSSSGAEFRIYSAHLKASYDPDDYTKRLAECTILRNHCNALPSGSHFFLGADLNIRESTEAAYQKLVGSEADNDGRFKDPINTPGYWHDAYAHVPVHTQSPRTTQFGGGAHGGMDDRFDQILISYAADDGEGISYIESSYVAYGNDAELEPNWNDNLNKSIIYGTNYTVGPVIAENLRQASDHLPVYLDIQVPAKIQTASSVDFGAVIVDAAAEENLRVFNVADPPADELNFDFSAPAGFSAPGDTFSVDVGDSSDHTISMSTTTSGTKSGDLEIQANDVDDPSTLVALSGTVLDHAQPSTQAGAVTTQDTVDFGRHDIGGFSDQILQIHNYDYDALQALLNVYDAQITGGDGRFTIVGGFSPSNVGATPASYTVTFDDSGAEAGSTYAGILTFSTRDQEGLPGGIDLSDLTYDLLATIEGGLSPIDDLTIQKAGATVYLVWTQKSGAELYRIYSDDTDPNFTPTTPTDSTTGDNWTDPAPPTANRYYLVRAVKEGAESGDSNRVGTFDKDLVSIK